MLAPLHGGLIFPESSLKEISSILADLGLPKRDQNEDVRS